MSMVELTATERKLADRIDQGIAKELAISNQAGGLAFVSMDQVLEAAKLMAVSSIAIPKHLRGNPGACFAVCIQALEWQMSIYAVANKSYSVNDRLSFEAQLVEAVILRRAPIKGRPKVEYSGEGEKRVCRVWAELRSEPGEIVEYKSPEFGRITPKNSPLWKADSDQQQFYYSVRAWCRRHFPDVLLGVYARDEIEDAAPIERVVSPKTLSSRLDALAQMPGKETVEHDPDTGEITDEASTQAPSAMDAPPATGQPASDPDPSQRKSEQPGAGAAAARRQDVVSTADAEKHDDPKTAAAYIQNTQAWIENLLDADAGEKRWKVEKAQRNKLNVDPDDRDRLDTALKAKSAALRGGTASHKQVV